MWTALGLTTAALVLNLSGCANEPLTGPMSARDLASYTQCSADRQCTYVQNGCCDCMNGGEDVAVRIDEKDAFRARFSCTAVACTEMGGQCGRGRAACVRGACTFVAER